LGSITGFLRGLRLPMKLLSGLFRKRKKTSEKEKKLRAYVYNFSPSRLKNKSWQKSVGKDKKRTKKRKKGKFSKKTNNFSKDRNY
jgi:hypothetical protein